jgi:hypothetical protein
MTLCAMFCVRGPRESTGRIFVEGSMASQSHSTCLAQRSWVRSSSNWRCGKWRWKKKRSCRVCAHGTERLVMAACRKPKTRGASEVSSSSASARSVSLRSAERGFSTSRKEWSRDDRRGNRLGSVASADDGACCAWLLLVGRKAEDGASQDTKAAPKRAKESRRQTTSKNTNR